LVRVLAASENETALVKAVFRVGFGPELVKRLLERQGGLMKLPRLLALTKMRQDALDDGQARSDYETP
jgi:hypothetical protein